MPSAQETFRTALEANRQGRLGDALRLFRVAAEQNHGPACGAMASVLTEGQFTDQDLPGALAYLRRGSAAGDEMCGLHLTSFLIGGFGGTRAWDEAIVLLAGLANARNAVALRELGLLCALTGDLPSALACLFQAAGGDARPGDPDPIAMALLLPALKSSQVPAGLIARIETGLARAQVPLALLNACPVYGEFDQRPDLNAIQNDLCAVSLKAVLDATLCQNPPIRLAGRAISPLLCDYLILSAAPNFRPAEILDPETGRKRQDPHRTGQTAMFSLMQMTPALVAIRQLMCSAAGSEPERGERLAVIGYRIGEEYRPHYDSLLAGEDEISPRHDAEYRMGGQRTDTVLLNLNEAFEGGTLFFPRIALEIAPRTGQIVAFANTDEHGRRHPNSLHQGRPVTAGLKLLASQWIREQPYPPLNAGFRT